MTTCHKCGKLIPEGSKIHAAMLMLERSLCRSCYLKLKRSSGVLKCIALAKEAMLAELKTQPGTVEKIISFVDELDQNELIELWHHIECMESGCIIRVNKLYITREEMLNLLKLYE